MDILVLEYLALVDRMNWTRVRKGTNLEVHTVGSELSVNDRNG